MVQQSVAGVRHKDQALKCRKRVFFNGSGALRRGQGLCYDRDYVTTSTGETATDPWEFRDNRVELPSTTNNERFAGVTSAAYAAVTGGQWIEIFEPGSVCCIDIGGVDTTINATYLTCTAGSGQAGRFGEYGMPGRGSALALETNTGGVIVSSLDGTAAVALTAVTKTGLFAGVVAGDYLVILASATTAGAAGATPGIYEIASVTDDDNAVLSSSAGTGDFAGYTVSGNPTVLALLLEGPESGLVEWVSPIDNTATQSMVGGVTMIFGGIELATGDATATLADGTLTGQKKGFKCRGALATQDYLVTVTSGIQMDGSTALATMEFDAANDYAFLEWFDQNWQLISYAGPTLA
jgi:hypothetical protein